METTALELFKPSNFDKDTLSLNVDLDDYFYLKQLQNRVVVLVGEINEHTAEALRQSILQINIIDKGVDSGDRVPIKLILTSDGGDVFEGFSLIDIIKNSLTPIYTINLSHWYSMATVVGVVGHKRYATKNATFLIHDGTTVIGDSSSKVHDFLRFDAQVQDRMKDIVTSHSGITSRTYNKKSREEWYFFADEAKKLGIIDGIIGEDVTLEDII